MIEKQRALILQGGVSLGAYEAGVCKELFPWVRKHAKEGENLFDIVMGTSVGAINGAIIVSHVAQAGANKQQLTPKARWSSVEDKLEAFWRSSACMSAIEYFYAINPMLKMYLQYLHSISANFKLGVDKFVRSQLQASPAPSPQIQKAYEATRNFDVIASAEGFRRYYSALQFLTAGVPSVYSSFLRPDLEYFNPVGLKPRIDNESYPMFSLRNSLERAWIDGTKYIQFPVKTNPGEKEPRFMLVSIDVRSGDSVVFDSYPKGKGGNQRYTEYGDPPHRLTYDEGIDWEHLRTTADATSSNRYPSLVDEKSTQVPKEERTFWDGTLMSNTPMRELIHEYREYWINEIGAAHLWNGTSGIRIPKLDIYIIDLWPKHLKDDLVPTDNDFTDDRLLDIIFLDKTEYDEKVTKTITDYMKLVDGLLPLARSTPAGATAADSLLASKALSTDHLGKSRTLIDLIKGQFEVENVIRIERKDDGDSVSAAMADYSIGSINGLIAQGITDARDAINNTYGGFSP